jgi:hypothetical protein
MNKAGSCCESLLPVPKCGFEPLREGVTKYHSLEMFSFIISMSFPWTASRDCGCHWQESHSGAPCEDVSIFFFSARSLACFPPEKSHRRTAGETVSIELVMHLVLFASSQDEQSSA